MLTESSLPSIPTLGILVCDRYAGSNFLLIHARGIIRYKYLAQEHNPITPRQGQRGQNTPSRINTLASSFSALHERT